MKRNCERLLNYETRIIVTLYLGECKLHYRTVDATNIVLAVMYVKIKQN